MCEVRQIWGELAIGPGNREDPEWGEGAHTRGTSNLEASSLRIIYIHIGI